MSALDNPDEVNAGAGAPATIAWARASRPQPCTYHGDNWDVLARFWYPLARVADLGDQPVEAKLLDMSLVVYRTAQGCVVARNQCPHRGVPLAMGAVEGDEIVCAYHGLRFANNGRCTKIPAQANVVPSSRFNLPVFPSVERYGLLWTCLNSETGVPQIVDFPEWEDATYQTITCPPVTIKGAPGRQIEGFIDVAHFAWVHHEAFADRDNPAVPLYQTRTTDYGFRSVYTSTVSNLPKVLQHLEPDGFLWTRTFDVHPPFVALLRVDFPDDGVLRIMNVASPVSARETRLFVPLVRNFDVTGALDDVYAFNAQVFAEDQVFVEAQMPPDLPLNFDDEAHFAADKSSIAYRKALRQLGLSG